MASSLIVVIPTAGRLDLLRRSLNSLSCCRKPSIYRKTIVIENGPKSGAEDVLKADLLSLTTHYLYEPIGNKSHALNKVLETERDCLIFFTDDDARFHEDILCAYAEAAQGIDGGQFYGGPVEVDYEQSPPAWLKTYLPPSAIGLNLGSHQKIMHGNLQPFLGINWAAFANDLSVLGGFNPDLGPGSAIKSTGQESDMHRRLFDHGVQQVHVPEAKVWHYVPTVRCSPQWILRRAFRQGVFKGYFRGKRIQTDLNFQALMWRKWRELLRNLLRTTFSFQYKTRFDALYYFALQSGRIHGFRKSRKTSSLPRA